MLSSANGCGFAKFYTPVYDNKFPSLVAFLFSWRCLATSTSSFLHAAMNLHPPSVTVSTHTSAFNAVVLQSPAMPNARISLWAKSVHSFPRRPLRTAPSKFPKTIRFGSRPPLIRRSVPAHKSLLVRNVVSMLSHRVISRARLYEGIRWSGAVCLDDTKQDSVVYGVEFGVVFLAKGPRTASIQEGLDYLRLNHSGLEGESNFRLVIELSWVPPDAHPACAGPSGDFNGHVRDFGHGAP